MRFPNADKLLRRDAATPQNVRRPHTALVAFAGVLATAATCVGMPAAAQAAVTTFGSDLAPAATANTAENLNYKGQDYITNGTGVVVHVNHDGADTALWNTALATGSPAAPTGGQITQIKLKGCAQPAAGGPAPLTQIHFQDLRPMGAGAFKVNVTTNPFDLPICGRNGDATTVSTFAPTNFCVSAGDYVDLNDEGGFDPNFYPSGVKYMVIGSAAGAQMDSFIRNNGTNNGAVISSTDTSNHDGFAVNSGEELLLQATLATGPDATPLCPGGTAGAAAAKQASTPVARASIPHQADGATRKGGVSVAVSCHGTTVACRGTLTVRMGRATRTAAFLLASGKTGHVKVNFGKALVKALHKGRGHTTVLATVSLSNLSTASATVAISGGR